MSDVDSLEKGTEVIIDDNPKVLDSYQGKPGIVYEPITNSEIEFDYLIYFDKASSDGTSEYEFVCFREEDLISSL